MYAGLIVKVNRMVTQCPNVLVPPSFVLNTNIKVSG
jgi:hypothetical protein